MRKGFKKGESSYPELNDKEWLHQKYWVEKYSASKIAAEVGCCEGTVLRTLKKQDIQKAEKYGRFLKDSRWLYQKYWGDKQSPRIIAEGIGCTAVTVWRALKEQNITMRTISEAHKDIYPSKEAREKMGKALKGNKNSLGCHPSVETRRKLSKVSIKMWIKKEKLTPAQRKINSAMRSGIYRALRDAKHGQRWINLVGYTVSDLMLMLEKEFREDMCWENYGDVWHIDHIIPLVRFKYKSAEDPEFKKAWALGNLQPLLIEENRKKYTKFMFF